MARVLTTEQRQASGDRADFMKRFFSVAVSVGFASKIYEFSFLSELKLPQNTDQLHQVILLLLAMTVVIGSWEFYFSSITKRPLVDRSRFYLDIIIVSFYIILLLSSKNLNAFLFYFFVIIFSYLIWDVLSMRVYPEDYGIDDFSIINMLRAFRFGMSWEMGHKTGVKATPFITLWWTFIFLGTFVYHTKFSPNFYLAVMASALIYITYRVDQRVQLGISWRLISLVVIVLVFITISSFGHLL